LRANLLASSCLIVGKSDWIDGAFSDALSGIWIFVSDIGGRVPRASSNALLKSCISPCGGASGCAYFIG